MNLRTEKADFAIEFLDLPKAAQVEGADWEPFQIEFLNNATRFGIDVKSRQIAWSFTAALDAVVDSIFNPGTPHVFVSINLDEAKEKIRYAKNIIAAFDKPVQKEFELASPGSKTEIEFVNGSRLISHPCRPVRGKPRARVYLDEMAHYRDGDDREIYTAALPATTKGDGYIRLGSSTMGASGLFWEIASEELRRYPGYDGNRRFIPWWQIQAFCRDVEAARLVAPEMPTEERVRALGTRAIIEISENMFLEDFQQEYECHLGSTEVLLADGSVKPISKLALADLLVYNTLDGQLKVCEVKNKKAMGKKQIVSVQTEMGTEFSASDTHKVVSSAGEIALKDAIDLQYIRTSIYSPVQQEALARIIGYNFGDGTITRRNRTWKRKNGSVMTGREYFTAAWYSSNRVDMERLARDFCIAKLTEEPPRVGFKKGRAVKNDCYQVQSGNQELVQKLITAGCPVGKKKYVSFEVPDWIMTGTDGVKREFLAALWGAEGISPIVSNGRVCTMPSLSMHKAKRDDGDWFFSQVVDLLGQLGIDAALVVKQYKPDDFRFIVYIKGGTSGYKKFFDNIGVRYADEKEKLFFLWGAYLGACLFNSEYRRAVISKMHNGGLSYAKIGERLGLNAATVHKLDTTPSSSKPEANFPYFEDWIDGRWDAKKNALTVKVVNREHVDVEDVYNITVDSPDHSYLLANGLNNYNCLWTDEAVAWISWDIIKRNQAVHDGVWFHAKSVDDVARMIPQILAAIRHGEIESVFAGGLDIGRKKDLTELTLLGRGSSGRLPVRVCVSLDRVEYDDQEGCFLEIVQKLPITQILVDQNGIGAQLAENLSKTGKAEGVTFTNASKELWAVQGRIEMERSNVPLPMDRDLAYQIHSIKKRITAAKNNVFDADRNEQHHADKTWALFLAIAAAGQKQAEVGGSVVVVDTELYKGNGRLEREGRAVPPVTRQRRQRVFSR